MFKSIFGLLLPVAIAFAQTTGTAILVGTVTDNTGAVVPGASVKIVNTETQFVYNGLTSPEGAYYVPSLIPGPTGLQLRPPVSNVISAKESSCEPASSPAST